jgi:purine-cytosine permease-like protein
MKEHIKIFLYGLEMIVGFLIIVALLWGPALLVTHYSNNLFLLAYTPAVIGVIYSIGFFALNKE